MQYRILKLIGRGANGDVFLAKKQTDNSEHVIKKLRMRDITERQRITIETQLKLLKEFKHVNIVPFRDSFIDEQGSLNIVMGYCEGGDMHNLIEEAEGKKFPQKQIIDWLIQLALSIFYLHERRILHRDIKTQNIFLTNGKIMLGDFGVSKVLDQAADLARTNIGTPYYMSPEQYRQKPYSYKSDIWAFGCIIYEMCNHRHVFEALNINSLAVKVMKGVYAPVSEFYSQNLRSLVDEMLSQNSKKRPSIIEILKKPFLFKKVKVYMKQILDNKEKYDPDHIISLKAQAKSLGIDFQETPKKKTENTPSKQTKRTESRYEKSRQKLKEQKEKKYKQLSEKLQRQIEERNKVQERLKQYQRESKVRRNSSEKVLSAKKIKKQAKVSSGQSSPHNEYLSAREYGSKSKPKLEEIDYIQKEKQQKKQKQRQLERQREREIQREKEREIQRERERERQRQREIQKQRQKQLQMKKQKEREIQEQRQQRQKQQKKQGEKNLSKKSASNKGGNGKVFKMQEQYDMDYEEYSDKEDELNQIDEEDQNDYDQDKQSVSEANRKIQQNIKISQSSDRPTTHPPESPQLQKKQSITSSKQLIEEKIDADNKSEADILEKEVKEKTIMISHIRNQMSRLDFVISSDSQESDRQEKAYNPEYTRLSQRINDMKQKLIAQLGRNGYSKFLQFIYKKEGKMSREEAVKIIGEDNIGLCHFGENIRKMDNVLKRIPMYSK